jgi:hypothetical protein
MTHTLESALLEIGRLQSQLDAITTKPGVFTLHYLGTDYHLEQLWASAESNPNNTAWTGKITFACHTCIDSDLLLYEAMELLLQHGLDMLIAGPGARVLKAIEISRKAEPATVTLTYTAFRRRVDGKVIREDDGTLLAIGGK